MAILYTAKKMQRTAQLTLPSDEYMTRKQAAAYLTSLGLTIAPQTLAKYASNGNALGGPAMVRISWKQVKYRRSELDAWARGKMREIR